MTIRWPHRVAPDAAGAWAETLGSLAAAHRARRTVAATSRWPLAHRCSAARRVAGVGAEPELEGTVGPVPGHAFCCRALA